jgi:GntR family negative regulator for fad regulon and positive regulator of fabA
VIACLADHADLNDTPEAFATFDWTLHHALTLASGNPVYTLILNGFAGFYEEMACLYFANPEARAASRAFYAALLDAARRGDGDDAERVTRATMERSIHLWQQASEE